MFGISPLGWVHTLGSLPAIPAALYMLAKHGRIIPKSPAGALYFGSMMVGAASVFLIAHQPVSVGIGVVTMLVLLAGYGVGFTPMPKSASVYIETVLLSISVFLLMAPTVGETLRRVPDGHPMIPDPRSPVLAAVQGGLLLALIAGLAVQIVVLRRKGANRQ